MNTERQKNPERTWLPDVRMSVEGLSELAISSPHVGYLHYCATQGVGEADLNKIEVFGERLSDYIRPFKLHRLVNEQYSWKSETYANVRFDNLRRNEGTLLNHSARLSSGSPYTVTSPSSGFPYQKEAQP